MTITKAIATRLAIILKQRKLTKNDLKSMPGVKPQSVNNIFRSSSTPSINLSTLYRICKALNMSMSQFLDDPIFNQIDIDAE